MSHSTRALPALVALSVTASAARAQAPQDRDHKLVLEAGPVAQHDISSGTKIWGGSIAAEVTPFEGGLEFELGFAALGGSGEHETSVDLLVMKPWQLSPRAELMVGLGPEFAWHAGGSAVSAEVVGHLMYWPRRNLGLFVEPGVSIQLARNGERSLGLAAGILIGFP